MGREPTLPDTVGTYTRAEAAEVLRVSESTIKRRIADGTLPTVPLGGRVVRLPAAVIDRLAVGESGAELAKAAGE